MVIPHVLIALLNSVRTTKQRMYLLEDIEITDVLVLFETLSCRKIIMILIGMDLDIQWTPASHSLPW